MVDNNTGHSNTGDWNTGHSNTGNRNTGDWNTGNRNTGNRNTGNSNTGHRNTGDWNTGNRNTGYCNTGHSNTGHSNTGHSNTGNRNTGHWNTGDWNTGHRNTGHSNTGDWNTGNRNTGDWNTGNRNTGHWNTGDWNTGHSNTGYCNTVTPVDVLIFNKIAKREDWDKADKPNWIYVDLTQWVEDSSMTDKEKEAYPSYVTTGGYLKFYPSLKAAYIEAWEKADKEDRDKTFKLPNFDPIVFEEIFGFNPCDCVEEKREHEAIEQDIITINGVEYIRKENYNAKTQ